MRLPVRAIAFLLAVAARAQTQPGRRANCCRIAYERRGNRRYRA